MRAEGRALASGRGAEAPWILALAAGSLFSWWFWKQGAYFGPVFYPGAIALALLLVLMLLFAPFPGRLRGAALVALAALFALAVWTGLSVLWSVTPASAPAYATRVFLYAGIFLLGIWLTLLARERMHLGLVPVALAGVFVAAATTATLLTGEDARWYLHPDATLRFPIGYRNANAAVFLLCLWPLLALATDNARHWALRAGAVATGTALIELAFLAQSRSSLPATALAVVVFLALSPHRLRAACLLGLAVLPAAIVFPDLLEVYRHGNDDAAVIPLLQEAARTVVVTTGLSFAIAALAIGFVYPSLHLGARRVKAISYVTAGVAVALCLVGAGVFLDRHGGPVTFVENRVDEFTSIGYPDLHEQGIRYGANVGSNRGDHWRVSIKTGREHPVLGGGAGSFRPAYLRERRSHETPHDPHSIWMLMFTELGIPGLIAIVVFFIAVGVAVLRSRALGPRAAVIASAALASGAQWLVPASFDWFWQYGGVTAPAIFLFGVASAPILFDEDAGRARFARSFGAVAAVAVVAISVPLFLADRFVQRGQEHAQSDPGLALDDFKRAAALSPFDPEPLIQRALLADGMGRRDLAYEALEQALEREPISYRAQYLLAVMLVDDGDPAATAAVRRARKLNPAAPELDELRRQLKRGGED